MATTNLTENGSQTLNQELQCSGEFTAGIHSQLIILSILNSFMSILAFLGNTLILVALHKETSLHLPSKILYRNLAITDLCVGIIGEPLEVAVWISEVNKRLNICRYTLVASTIAAVCLCGVSLFTLTAISVDRLLALLLGLRYRQVVTPKRTFLVVASFWAASIISSIIRVRNFNVSLWPSNIVTAAHVMTSIVCYTKIFLTLRQQQIQVQDLVHQRQPNQPITLNIARYRKALSGALWVQLTMVACYVPFVVVSALLAQGGLSSSIYLAYSLTTTLVFLNSSLNPFLYCWKIREIRQAVRDTIGQLGCSWC